MPHNRAIDTKALGDFLRRQRERLTPEMLGLPTTSRRRTPGLRREEVAQLSAISATWYTWVEQGREVVIAPATLARIAKALRLNTANRDYLFILADVADPDKKQHSDEVNETVLHVVQQMKVPCYLLDVSWDLLVWNPPAQQLFTGWLGQEDNPNLLHFMFFHPLAKTLIKQWSLRAKRLVAEFRAESSHYTTLAKVTGLIDDLLEQSDDFRDFWQQQEVMIREGGEREFQHATAGLLHYQQATFYPSSNLSLKLVVLMPQ